MEPFLKRFAHQLLELHGAELEQVCIVLPGKRAGTFLRKYLAEARGSTQWSPRLHDVGSFLSHLADMRQGGSMEMLFMLYHTHKTLRGPEAEPLDAFLQWAPTALRDMSELDAHALDLDQVYRDLKSYYEMEDWAESLGDSPGQIRSGEHWRTTGLMHRAMLAYASDFHLIVTSSFPHGFSFLQSNVQIASLDHAMWFHRPFRVDEWLLYSCDSPTAQGGRGLARGQFFDRAGRLVASTAQEGLIRLKDHE